jgi:hypothetical protein
LRPSSIFRGGGGGREGRGKEREGRKEKGGSQRERERDLLTNRTFSSPSKVILHNLEKSQPPHSLGKRFTFTLLIEAVYRSQYY